MFYTKDYTMTRCKNILQIQDISGESFVLYREGKFTALSIADSSKTDLKPNRSSAAIISISLVSNTSSLLAT